MKKKQLIHVLVFMLVACSACLFSCSPSQDSNTVTPEFPTTVTNIVSPNLIDSLRNEGMTIYSGNTPPNVNGIYYISPYTLLSPYHPTDIWAAGYVFDNTKFQFLNQSENTVQINFKDSLLLYAVSGLSGVMTGQGNNFTIFSYPYPQEYSGISFTEICVVSGTYSSSGIQDFYVGFIVASKNGDATNTIVEPVNASRVWYDADKWSPTVFTY